MGMPLEKFFVDILEPIIVEFKAGYDQPHKGFAAVHAVDSLASHIFLALKESNRDPFETLGLEKPLAKFADDSAFGSQLAPSNSSYQLVRDVAKANKHAKLVRHTPRVNGSADTSVKSVAYGQGAYGAARYGGVPQLMITELNGEIHPLERTIDEALEFLMRIARCYDLI